MPFAVLPVEKVIELGRENPRYMAEVLVQTGLLGSVFRTMVSNKGSHLVEYAAIEAGMNYLHAEKNTRFLAMVAGNEDDYLAFWTD